MNEVEIRNKGNRSVWVSVVKSRISGRIYVYVSTEKNAFDEGEAKRVLPRDYAVINAKEVLG